jgi:hypothetical protein
MKGFIAGSSEVNGFAHTIVEAGHDIVSPFIDIADGASTLIGMFV